MLPSDPTATSRGRDIAPEQVVCDQMIAPVDLSTLMIRLSYVSATYTPVLSLSFPNGDIIFSGGEDVALKFFSTVPDVFISTRPLFPVSVIHITLESATSSERFRGLLKLGPEVGTI